MTVGLLRLAIILSVNQKLTFLVIKDMTFSKRMNISPSVPILQVKSMDDRLRTSLWNAIYSHMLEPGSNQTTEQSSCYRIIKDIWANSLYFSLDGIPIFFNDTVNSIKKEFFNFKWNEVYDLIEYIAVKYEKSGALEYIELCNEYLKRENSGYRFAGTQLIEITNETELNEIIEASKLNGKFGFASTHIKTAIAAFSDRNEPDYRNAGKEAISAIEAVCNSLLGKKTSGVKDGLKFLVDTHGLHKALSTGFNTLYGYTSDKEGVRHALMDKDDFTKADAKYLIVTCSAFVNYVNDIAS